MKKFTFDNVASIEDFQIISQTSGILLTEDKGLYCYQEDQVEKLETPTNFIVNDFHFIDSQHGMIIGKQGSLLNETSIVKASLGVELLLPLFLVAFLLVGIRKVASSFYRKFGTIIFGTLFYSLVLVSCSTKYQMFKAQNPDRLFETSILSTPKFYSNGCHSYPANKELKCLIAFTNNGGESWETHPIHTNFELTTVTSLGKNYLVGTFANQSSSKDRPYHGDGDLFVYGTDDSFCKDLQRNTSIDSTNWLSIQRGITGVYLDKDKELAYVYGSETEPSFPKDEMSTSPGNINVFSFDLKSKYRILDTPGISNVNSLSVNDKGDLWVVMDDLEKVVEKGYVRLESNGTHKLYVLEQDSNCWEELTILDEHNNFFQIEFIEGTDCGFLLSEKENTILKTVNGGNTWIETNCSNVKQIQILEEQLWALTNSNELVVVE